MIRGPAFDAKTNELGTLELQLPALRTDDVLIEVHFAGLNRADVEQAQGGYPPPAGESLILGLECSGRVKAVGASVTKFRPGEAVMALVAGGAFGNFVVAHQNLTFIVPKHLSLQEAVAIPESLFTFWANAVMEGHLSAGKSFLIHGGASGLGSFSVVMAKALGARVFATARGEERVKFVQNLGCEICVNTQNKNVNEIEQALSRVDVILDHIGAEYFEMHIRLLNKLGTLILINSVTGASAQLDLDLLIGKRLKVMGSLLRSRSLSEKTAIAQQIEMHALPLINSLRIQIPVSKEFSISELSAAIQCLEERKSLGKIVLKVST
jgi:NADPH:quinone reductase